MKNPQTFESLVQRPLADAENVPVGLVASEERQRTHYESHSFEYLHMTDQERESAFTLVEEIKSEAPVQQCRTLMLKNGDNFTWEHSERQAVIMAVLCDRLGISAEYKRDGVRAAFAEDIAKETKRFHQILSSPVHFEGQARAAAMPVIMPHPVIGMRWVRLQTSWDSETRRIVAGIVGAHHWFAPVDKRYGEAPDPDVAFVAQVAEVADLCDAFGSARPYKEVNTIEESYRKVREQFTGPQAIIDAAYPTLAVAA